jgi:hypothetical protein
MILRQKDKAWNGDCQALQDTKNSILYVKKQSDDGHIIQQSGNHSRRIRSTMSGSE